MPSGGEGWSSGVERGAPASSGRATGPAPSALDGGPPALPSGLRERRAAAGPLRAAVPPRAAVLPSSPGHVAQHRTLSNAQAQPPRGQQLPTFESLTAHQPEQRLKANADLRDKLDAGMFPYQRIAKGNYQPNDALSKAVADKVWSSSERANEPGKKGLLPSEHVQRPTGTLVDNASGLVVSLLVNHKDKDIAAVFGGTASGRVAGSPLKLALGNTEMTVPQWTANARTALGLPTRSHDQAQRVVSAVKDLQSTPEFRNLADYSVSTMGHSKGGGEAASAAIANHTFAAPIKVTGLSSAPLNQAQLRQFARQGIDVADAAQHIDIHSVKLDLVPNLGHLLKGVGATAVGTEHFYPAGPLTDPLTRHVMSDKIIRAELQKQDDAIRQSMG